MRIVIVAVGSLGDVAPFTGPGKRLSEVGHEVSVAERIATEYGATRALQAVRRLA